MRNQNRFSLSYSRCKGEHFERKKNIFRFFFSGWLGSGDGGGGGGVKTHFYQKFTNVWIFFKISVLSLGYQTLHTKKHFCDEMFLEISVRENGQPYWFLHG